MKYDKTITEKQYAKELAKLQKENENIERLRSLEKERRKYRFHLQMPSTSKLIMIYLFVILNIILVFSMVSMWHFADLSYLGALITDIAAQVITFFIYAQKSMRENLADSGYVYEARMKDLNGNGIDDRFESDEEESSEDGEESEE